MILTMKTIVVMLGVLILGLFGISNAAGLNVPVSNIEFEGFIQTSIQNGSLVLQVSNRGDDDTVSAPTHSQCGHVTSVPSHVKRRLRFSSFYTKYAHAYGIPVVSSYRVRDKALLRACYVMRFLFADRADVRDWFYRRRGRAAIMAVNEGTTTIPEHSFLPAWWNQRARGLGATIQIPVSTGGEENLLCLKGDRYFNEDIFLHEFVHGIHNLGATGAIRGFDARLSHAYRTVRSRTSGWVNTYAMSTDREYFAEGTQSFFHVNAYSARANGVHGYISTRAKLRQHDRVLYNLIREVFPCGNTFLKRCDAAKGTRAPSFKMDCDKNGGKVVTDKPRPPVTQSPTACNGDQNTMCKAWANRGECTKNSGYMLISCCKSCKTPTKPNTPPLPSTPQPNTPPLPNTPQPKPTACNGDQNTMCKSWANRGECTKNPGYMLISCCKSCKTPTKPNTPPLPSTPQPNTPPLPSTSKPNTPPLPGTPQPNTPPLPSTPQPKPNTPPLPSTSQPKPNTPPPPSTSQPKPNTPPPPSTPQPKPNTPPLPSTSQPKPNTPPLPSTSQPKPNTPPLPTPPKPTCQDSHQDCAYWASIGECQKNRTYMLPNCCKSCSGSPCKDNSSSCRSWAQSGYCRTNSFTRKNCKKSCKLCT